MPSSDTVSSAPSRPGVGLLLSLLVAMVLAALDQSIVATALPVIAGQMHGIESMSWVVTVFMLTSTISAPLYGKLSDLYGQRPLFVISIAAFVAASLLCGIAANMPQLIAFRGLQGLGAGGLMTLSQTVIGRVVPVNERGRYQGLFSGAFAVSTAAGPLLGGFITASLSWRWVFLINVPLGALALFGLWRTLPALPPRPRPAIDYAGAATLCIATSALLLLTHSFTLTQNAGVAISLVLGLVAFVGFGLLYRIERRAEEPIIDPQLFANRRFTVASLATAAMSFAMSSSMVFMPLYYQAVLRQTPTQSGLMTLPMVAMMLISSVLGGQISARRQNYVNLLLVGVGLECLGLLLLLIFASVDASAPYFFVTMAVLGVGMGIGMPNATVIVQSSVAAEVMGAATATMSFCRSLGGALGVAVSGAIMTFVLGEQMQGLPASLRALDLLDALSTVGLPVADLARMTELYRHAINASLFAGAAFMFLAWLLVLSLKRQAGANQRERNASRSSLSRS